MAPALPPRRSLYVALGLACHLLGTGCEVQNKYLVTPEMFDRGQGSSHDGATSDTPDTPPETVADSGPFGFDGLELARVDSSIWTSLMAEGDEALLVTLDGNRAVVFDITDGPHGLGDPVLLLSNEPVPGFEVTDISAARLDDRIYLAASNPGASDIVIGAYGLDGSQRVAPLRVVERSFDPTNDMKLVQRDGQLVLSYGADGDAKHFMAFDSDLSVVVPDTVTEDPAFSSQLGCVVPTAHGFTRIAGNHINHGLVGVEFGTDWSADSSDVFELPIPAEENEWIWFSSGCVEDLQTGDWYVAFQHMWDGDEADLHSSVRIARFDADWTFLEDVQLSEAEGFTRPQLAIKDDTLYVSFDKRLEVWAGRTRLDPER